MLKAHLFRFIHASMLAIDEQSSSLQSQSAKKSSFSACDGDKASIPGVADVATLRVPNITPSFITIFPPHSSASLSTTSSPGSRAILANGLFWFCTGSNGSSARGTLISGGLFTGRTTTSKDTVLTAVVPSNSPVLSEPLKPWSDTERLTISFPRLLLKLRCDSDIRKRSIRVAALESTGNPRNASSEANLWLCPAKNSTNSLLFRAISPFSALRMTLKRGHSDSQGGSTVSSPRRDRVSERLKKQSRVTESYSSTILTTRPPSNIGSC
mmetsp:Transcript_32612/g.83386  ORF Transcript_32612/g.83386 Transcript_32612/m.83386 type:complete len:269 (+) Transcript_32612:7642-8448(+)